ncbi:MAG: methylenetetrahydrofolate reductase C-terminal domain-containing protein [Planctomycetota bacterium]
MIVAERKPFEEILKIIVSQRTDPDKCREGAKKVLVLGCGGCVTVCQTGGAKEAGILASMLRLAPRCNIGGLEAQRNNQPLEVTDTTVERQCDVEFIEPLADKVKEADIVLSMACGAGVQFMSEKYPVAKVRPAMNTTFLGVTEEPGLWTERCAGCGNCIIDRTDGICPVTRCSKSLFNGPCGGSQGGKCEVSQDIICIWQVIHDRLKEKGKLEYLDEIIPVKDWRTSRDGGPRRMKKEVATKEEK